MVVCPQCGVVCHYCAHVIYNIGETLINVGPTCCFPLVSYDTVVTEVVMCFHAMCLQSGCMFMYCVVCPQCRVVCCYSVHVIYNIGETVINMGPTKLFSISV